MVRITTSILRALTSAIFGAVVVSSLNAEPIPGANDPVLREAALTWLAEPSEFENVLAIAELAADGNVAARLLLNSVFYQRWLDFPELDRASFLASLPEDRTGSPRSLRPYSVADDQIPAFEALRKLDRTYSADEWATLAQDVVDAGLDSRLRPHIGRALLHHPSIQLEALSFAEEYLSDDPYVQIHLWTLYGTNEVVTELLARGSVSASNSMVRWAILPWPEEQAMAFRRAIEQDHWGALYAVGRLQRLFPEFPQDVAIGPAKRRMAALITDPTTTQPPSTDEIVELAEILRINQERFLALGTMHRICQMHCLTQQDPCLVMSAFLLGTGALNPHAFSPVLSEEEYMRSDRAARELLILIGAVANQDFRPGWLQVPQCLKDPAITSAEASGYPNLR